MKREQGYTLIEILVVLALITALSSTGVWSWQQWQQQHRLWQVASQVRHYLVMLRNDANWHRRDRLLRVEDDGSRWCLSSLPVEQPGCPSGNPFVMRPEWPDIALSEITASLGFYGLRSTAWSGHITLKNSAGSWTVIVSVWGRIRLCEEGKNRGCQ